MSVVNEGDVPVDIATPLVDGGRSVVTTLAPGEQASRLIEPAESVLLVNRSDTLLARLRVRIWGGDASVLGMRYTSAE